MCYTNDITTHKILISYNIDRKHVYTYANIKKNTRIKFIVTRHCISYQI